MFALILMSTLMNSAEIQEKMKKPALKRTRAKKKSKNTGGKKRKK